MAKNFLKKCAVGCSGGGPGCQSICPPDWFCAFGEEFDEDLRETECRTGRCIQYPRDSDDPDTPIILQDSMCQRCDQGYVILHWEDSYISDSGTGDCEYVSDCPEVCVNYDNSGLMDACTSASSCPKTGCGREYDCDGNSIPDGSCPDEETEQECKVGGGGHCWAETLEECFGLRNKSGEATISCCSCVGCYPNPCSNPCPDPCDPGAEYPCVEGRFCHPMPTGSTCGTYYTCV